MKFFRWIARNVLAALCALTLCGTAWAQAYPNRPITVIVPFAPGGSSDATMRAVSGKLAEELGKPVVLDNKPGANGTIGAALVARSAPDGYTLLVGSVGTYAITPSMLGKLSYDTRKDLEPLTLAVRTPNLIVVRNDLPVANLADLVAYMKQRPGQVSFASSGIGSTDHLTAVLFWQKTGTQGVHVPYKGGGAAISDLMGGQVDVLITNLGVLAGQVKAGRMKALAITSAQRHADFPQLPTVAEAGLKDLEVYSWQGISGPAGLPKEVIGRLNAALVSSLKDPVVHKTLQDAGFDIVGSSPAEFASVLAAETVRWKAVIDAAGIKPE